MNLYEAIELVYIEAGGISANQDSEAAQIVSDMLDAYDALAPTPEMFSQYPWAQWYALDADGVAHYYEVKPQPHDRAFWFCGGGKYTIGQRREIHEHVNWRSCLWPRPEVQP